MKQTTLKFAGVALAIALAVTAKADVAIHQNVSAYGYIAGSASYSKDGYKGAKSDTDMDIDAAKLGFAFDFAPVTAKISFYTDRGADDIYVLEANATYNLGNGLSITGGRYQSWIGYEAFDIPNTSFITYGMPKFATENSYGALIPSFNEGVKVEYAFDKMTVGLSLTDSIYGKYMAEIDTAYGDLDLYPASGNPYRGDGSLSDGYGVEGHFGYNDGALSIGATLAYEKAKDLFGYDYDTDENYTFSSDTYVLDVWAQYIVKNTTFAGEFFYSQRKYNNIYLDESVKITDYYALVMVKQQFNEKFSLAGRLSTGSEKVKEADDNSTFWKASVVPSYAITKNLDVRAEVSYTKYGKDAKDYPKSNTYVGVQAIFKF